MPIPEFDHKGELPEGIHQATIDEVYIRFGGETEQRKTVTAALKGIFDLAIATGKLERLILFGNYLTSKSNPNDVDVVLVMSNDFNINECDEDTRILFDHKKAEEKYGDSIFWIRPAFLILDTLHEFIEHWQIKRDRSRRGIVEVKP